MREHFQETRLIRNALISGNIAHAVKPAHALAEMKGVETLPRLWQDGRACGACHVAVAGPKAKLDDPPSGGDTMKERMLRHQWGTERMWEGLYVPSNAAWKAGVEMLERDTFPKKDVSKGGVHAISAASRFTKLIAKAKAASSSADRAATYAEVLGTCAPCHSAMGIDGH